MKTSFLLAATAAAVISGVSGDSSSFKSRLGNLLSQASAQDWVMSVNSYAGTMQVENIDHEDAVQDNYIITTSQVSQDLFYNFIPLLSDELDFTVKALAEVGSYRVSVPSGTDFPIADLRNVPFIKSIEQEIVVYTNASISETVSSYYWGLDRVDSASGTDGKFNSPGDGTGVIAYVIDTGLLTGHAEFPAARVQSGYSTLNGDSSIVDCQGHGSHVAGTIAGANSGIARNAYISPIRVFSCSGGATNADIIEGIDWAITDRRRQGLPAVINMSLGGGKTTALNNAVRKAYDASIVVVVAAGNENQNACNVSPASEPTAITVGATTSSDTRSSFSNYGTCVDIFAPGSNIVSAGITSKTALASLSGTSMASPHVAGAVAVLLSLQPSLSTAQVASVLINSATNNAISNVNGSPNKFLYLDPSWATTSGGGTTTAPTSVGTQPPASCSASQKSLVSICGTTNSAGYIMSDLVTVTETTVLTVSVSTNSAATVYPIIINRSSNGVLRAYKLATASSGNGDPQGLVLSKSVPAGTYAAGVLLSNTAGSPVEAVASMVGAFTAVSQSQSTSINTDTNQEFAEVTDEPTTQSSASSGLSTGAIIGMTVAGTALVTVGVVGIIAVGVSRMRGGQEKTIGF